MYKQLNIFDLAPEIEPEPQVGEWVYKHGPVIPHIMRRSYIGKKVLMDKSTQSMECYKVGILERVVEGSYYNREGKEVKCDRSFIFDGGKQRNIITHMPGSEIFEIAHYENDKRRK